MPAIFTVRRLDEPAVTEGRKYSAKPAKQEGFKVGTVGKALRLLKAICSNKHLFQEGHL